MKARDSGMPEEQMWASFFDAPRMLAALGFTGIKGDVADFGCGYGTFTIAAANLTTATVFAFDIEREMIEATAHKAQSLGMHNVCAVHRDVIELGSGLADIHDVPEPRQLLIPRPGNEGIQSASLWNSPLVRSRESNASPSKRRRS